MNRSTYLIITSTVFSVVMISLLTNHIIVKSVTPIAPKQHRNTRKIDKPPEDVRKEKLGDGCYHVFLDVGANIGVHGRFIYEPKKYVDVSPEVQQLFTDHFGDRFSRDPRDICVFAFEPNPAHKERHQMVKKAYEAVGIRYHPISAGASNTDGNLIFYHQGDEENSEWGFSVKDFGTNKKEGAAVSVPVIRLKSWISEHIYGRVIPETPFGGNITLKKTPAVLMKMDIEGSEFDVLPDLMGTGSLCSTIDLIFGEWHLYMGKEKQELITHLEPVLNILTNVPDCKFKGFLNIDDEAYLRDGIEFPSGKPWWGEGSE